MGTDHRPVTGTLRAPTPTLGSGRAAWWPSHPRVPTWLSGWILGGFVNRDPPAAPPWPCRGGWARVSSPESIAVPTTSPGVQLIPGAGAAGVTLLSPVTPPPSEGHGGLQPPRSEHPGALRLDSSGTPLSVCPEDPAGIPGLAPAMCRSSRVAGTPAGPPGPGGSLWGRPRGCRGIPKASVAVCDVSGQV